VTNIATKHANISFLSWLGGFSLHFSLGVEGWLGIGWVVSFGGFDGFLFLVVVGARNKVRNSLPTFVLTPLKAKTQSVCGFDDTLLNLAQVILNHFLAQNGFLKMSSQISDLLLKLGVLFGSMEKITLERDTRFAQRG
jgi:hypothetical protein